jgi:hypothetical protein
MDDQYREYFRERAAAYERYGGVPPFWESERHPVADEAVSVALEAARSAALEVDAELRDDAQLLIFLLARELVARPVSAVRPQESAELAPDLTADTSLIVRRAAELSTGGEVSAHGVIDALSGTWDDLRSGRYNVWDRSRRREEGDINAE